MEPPRETGARADESGDDMTKAIAASVISLPEGVTFDEEGEPNAPDD